MKNVPEGLPVLFAGRTLDVAPRGTAGGVSGAEAGGLVTASAGLAPEASGSSADHEGSVSEEGSAAPGSGGRRQAVFGGDGRGRVD